MLGAVVAAIAVATLSAALAASPSSAATHTAIYLNEVLTDEQEALLGCGPYWGTDCALDGIDFTNLESSVLLQSFPGIDGGDVFASEMAALSWNFLMVLVAMSQPLPDESPGDEHFDPDDPMGAEGPRCSFATPQYCSSVQSFFEVPEPEGALLGSAACGSLALVARRSRRA